MLPKETEENLTVLVNGENWIYIPFPEQIFLTRYYIQNANVTQQGDRRTNLRINSFHPNSPNYPGNFSLDYTWIPASLTLGQEGTAYRPSTRNEVVNKWPFAKNKGYKLNIYAYWIELYASAFTSTVFTVFFKWQKDKTKIPPRKNIRSPGQGAEGVL